MKRGTPVVRVYRSNRTERLAERFADVLEKPALGPLEPETIVVQGRGMAVWLSQRLAVRHRIAANLEFIYPRELVGRAFRAVLGDDAAPDTGSEDPLLWRVLGALPRVLERPEFSRVARYLEEDGTGIRRFELASRIATRFDQYVVYRPQMVRAWDRGEDGGVRAEHVWQPLLWRAISGEERPAHLAALEGAYRAALKGGREPVGVPKRIALFGMSSLPPLLVRVIALLARHVELHLFVFAPSPKDYWAHARPRQIALALDEGPGPEALHLEVGNPLLASTGALGVEFESVLEQGLEHAGVGRIDREDFAPPDAPGMLGAVQQGIFELSPDADGGAPRPVVREDDSSITVHSCHGPLREVEVLHDQLLDLLTRGEGTLRPEDVVVMMPDVDAYAPVIEAVFERRREIPYRISDRSVRRDGPAIDAFRRILGLVGKRAEASSVLDLLGLEPVARRFGMEPTDFEQVADWVVASGIRWGIDEAHRAEHGQPRERQNTWRFGLDRMLVGYALPTEGRASFAGVLPFDEIEGTRAELLGKVAEFTERLFEELRALASPRPLSAWRADLGRAFAALVATDRESAWQHQLVLSVLSDIADAAEAAGWNDAIGLDVMRKLLDRRVDLSYPERGFLSYGVTFCAMVPMRSIPFRVVCLLGMNDGAFPRSSRPVEFDLLKSGPGGPRAGDRDRRKDDRYLFLEAVMAARERLIVTYTGQSIRDNRELPPSVVVSELLDRVLRNWDPDEPYGTEMDRLGKLRRRLVLLHPLQAWSARYFDGKDARLFSFDQVYLRGALHAGGERSPPPPFFEAPLAAPDSDEVNTIALAELVRFYQDPIAYLLDRRLGVRLRDVEIDVPDREPLEIGPLDRWRLGTAVLGDSLAGLDRSGSAALARGRGDLPLGAYGELVHGECSRVAEAVAERVRAFGGERPRPPVAVDRFFGEGPDRVRIQGEIGDLSPSGIVRSQFSFIHAKNQLALWVRHLVLCWAVDSDSKSVLVGRGSRGPAETFELAPVRAPGEYLSSLIRWYRVGLAAPLRFLPRVTLAYTTALLKDPDERRAIDTARRQYETEIGFSPHVARVFGRSVPGFEDVSAAAGDFAGLAREIVLPMLAARVEP